jgi:uncharacterized protein (DUF2461 family)
VIEVPAFRKYFGGISGEKLKTAPRGYAVDDPQIELIRHTQFMVHHSLSDEQVLAPDFPDYAMAVFAAMKPFLDYLQPLVGPQMRPTRVPPKREEGKARRDRTG